MPAWLTIAGAAIFALPFGWGAGLVAAYAIAGKNFGQLPVATVPLGIAAALMFALSPKFKPSARLGIMFGGSVAFIVMAWLLR